LYVSQSGRQKNGLIESEMGFRGGFILEIIETLEIITDPELMEQLKTSIDQVNTGKTINWKKAKEELKT
jgi:hypothetical protein